MPPAYYARRQIEFVKRHVVETTAEAEGADDAESQTDKRHNFD